ncbi:uncharacterized protein LOC130612923 [Hydractinia symbiolongicarpus]|uniref:uncharacterized protein LOC130612923 n=1 Tax=Hydractinia symbiolongicarpus TaxID=13093 RepID=UPI0025506B16|nr:uncharacterized protein LOC130612923 [Hydractinia symbiolongicarpus]
MTEDISKKRRSRGAYVGVFKKIVNETVKPIYERFALKDHGAVLLSSYDLLEAKLLNVTTIQNEINDLIESENLANEMMSHLEFEQYAAKELTTLKKFLDKHVFENEGNVSVTSSDGSGNSSVRDRIKLPKLELKKFNGDPLQWKSFDESFECAIHKNESLSSVEKLTYLTNLLSGSAEQTISGLSLCNENYEIARDLLKERFGDPQITVSAHMNKLLTLENVKSSRDIKSMRKLYDLIESQVRSLKALGFKAENYGPMLIPVVLSKLPNDIKLMISRKFDEDIWDAEAVLKFLRKEIMAREKLSNIKLEEDEQREFPSSGSSLNAQAARTGTRKLFCSFCSGEHKSHECRTVTKLETRKEIVLKNGRCFLCLRKGHMSRECKASFRCFHCKGKHHVALCEKKHNPNPPPSRSPKKNETENKDAETEDSSLNVTPANINIASDRNNVLLQTAMATVTSCDGNYITPQARKRLNLKTVSKKELSIKVFGGEHSTKKLDLVKFEIKSTISNESINVSTFVNDICKPVSGQTINFAVENYEHLQGLQLADQNFSDDLHVDILIGADYYWNFFTKTVLRSSSGGPVAMGSKLGFILSGPVSTVSTTPVTANMACTHSLLIMKETQSDYEILNENVNKFYL